MTLVNLLVWLWIASYHDLRIGVGLTVQEELREAHHHCHWRPKLVGRDRDEVVLALLHRSLTLQAFPQVRVMQKDTE